VPDSQIRSELITRLAYAIRNRMPDAPDPELLARVSLDALPDGTQWLMRMAEHYQARADAAEALLVARVEPVRHNPLCRLLLRRR